MPLLVTDYSWTQTHSTVYINVPLKGAKAAKVDILSTDQYLKVHFPPFLFEAFLCEPVDDDKSTARFENGVAIIILPKRTNKLWENLMITTSEKEIKKEIREKALLKHHEKVVAQSKAKAEKQQMEQKYALKAMMKLEEEKRDSIQKSKDNERMKTTAELEAWQITLETEKKAQIHTHNLSDSKSKATSEKQRNQSLHGGTIKSDQTRSSQVSNRKQKVDLPAPRASGHIQVTFTPRVFPTALRESRVAEEEEWLRKQAEARRAINADFAEMDLKEEERNPDWLKEKGDKCFAIGDYMGAVNAYNLAISLNRKIPALFSNRAACHLKLKNLHKAIEDSSQALDLLTPPVVANAAARSRAHVRRGSAFCQLQLYAEGLQDYEAALKIYPQNEGLQADAQRIRDIIQGSVAQ